jgi:hypothetical protein
LILGQSGVPGAMPGRQLSPYSQQTHSFPHFNKLRNIERSCARGKFQKINGNCDAMDRVAYNFKDLDSDPNWIEELIDYNDPESLLIARDTLHQLQDHLGQHELSVLLGYLDIDRYCTITGISRRSGYRRLARSRRILDEQVVADID